MKMRVFHVVAVAALAVVVSGCATRSGISGPSGSVKYDVTIQRTDHGIPHITAADYGSLGFGEGYAVAQDHVCNIADAIVVARGEQALYFGPGEKNAHVITDALIRALDIPGIASAAYAQQAPEDREWLEGFVAGYNRYIADENITSWCNGADFVQQVTGEDIMARMLSIVPQLPRMAAMIAAAQPPNGDVSARIDVAPELLAQAMDGFEVNGMGSNGWAIGKDRTANGRGMLLANPHYPWNGTNRFWEKHLIIPGEVNVYGSGLVGIPGVAIGFNENVGWTHTVSNSERVVVYKLDLVPGDPTSYLYDGEPRKMTARTVSVPIKTENGIVEKEFTFWFSHYGPMASTKGLEWTDTTAYTLRDANMENVYARSQWKDMSVAKNMDEFIQAHRKWNAMPWVNTIAASSDGRAVYMDDSTVGHLSDEAIALWYERVESDPLTKGVWDGQGLILLDGSDSTFEFVNDPRSMVPGVVPFDEKPIVDRFDFAFNSNDSYWLTNPSAPLTGHSPLFGPVETPRSMRTRVNAIMLSDTSAEGHYGPDGRFTLEEMQKAIFSNRSLAAELLRDELVAATAGVGKVDLEGNMIDISEARQVIAGYNGKLDLDSKGAVLFREWLTAYDYDETFDKSSLFAVPFDPSDPLNTPRGLADKDVAAKNLAHAVEVLNRAGLALDATLADAQFAWRCGTPIAVHGGNSHEGIANLIRTGDPDFRGCQLDETKIDGSRTLTDKGYPITHGSSFVLTLNYTDNGPRAEALLTYCESGDPTSAHYTDQTHLFAKKQFRPIHFTKEAIDANTIEVMTFKVLE